MPPESFSGPPDFDTVYRDYHARVYNYVYGRLLHREAAEDVTADVFAAVFRHFGEFDPARGSLAAWIFTIAGNLTRNYLLRVKNRREEIRETVPERPENAPKERDDSLRLPENVRAERILERLSEEEREFLELRYAFGFSNEEIGRLIGTTRGAVSQRYRRLLSKCRKIDMSE